MKPQNRDVLELLRKRGDWGVTALDALTAVGCFRLAARVGELRDCGFEIEAKSVTTPGGKRITSYRLIEETQLAAGF